MLLRLLRNRLCLVADRLKHPDLAAQEIRSPWVVTGLPRSGTTFLHRLLAQDPGHRAPLYWETQHPSPPPDPRTAATDVRIAATDREAWYLHALAPKLRHQHPLSALQPEECILFMGHSFRSYVFQDAYHVPSFMAWLEAADMSEAYAEHREYLQHQQLHFPARRWVLKAPAHLFALDRLYATYPDVGIVITHRNPLQAMASNASLHTTVRGLFSRAVKPSAVALELAERWARGMRRALAARDSGAVPPARFIDIRYDDLVRDPLGTVRRIYAGFDTPLTPAALERIQAFLEGQPKSGSGRHRYSAAQFGLEEEREGDRFAFYRERFDL